MLQHVLIRSKSNNWYFLADLFPISSLLVLPHSSIGAEGGGSMQWGHPESRMAPWETSVQIMTCVMYRGHDTQEPCPGFCGHLEAVSCSSHACPWKKKKIGKHKDVCRGLLNKRPLSAAPGVPEPQIAWSWEGAGARCHHVLPSSLFSPMDTGNGEAGGSIPNQFVAFSLYTVQIRHKSLHATLQMTQFSSWGRHWWALPS